MEVVDIQLEGHHRVLTRACRGSPPARSAPLCDVFLSRGCRERKVEPVERKPPARRTERSYFQSPSRNVDGPDLGLRMQIDVLVQCALSSVFCTCKYNCLILRSNKHVWLECLIVGRHRLVPFRLIVGKVIVSILICLKVRLAARREHCVQSLPISILFYYSLVFP